ncbi:membrane protein insertase YidC [Geomicrobium sp. JCM 19038]|uniref:membrane protein insertase YidC n=1 Tax=Geomicrobium sp. JCM 19038 TaxID=1460635 RepID=UPI00045F46D2|nr:membrane protein insertase YidC [Geomicrobium sp. JCM 19038]GAK10307.1 inner membrane protein translocase component YidC, short form OxaI-like [Geomicrobium sp. JCM 19038]
MKRRLQMITLLVIALIVLAACGMDQAPITSESEGIWDHFFVFPLSWLIIQAAELFNGSYGLAIMLMTVVIRLAILPLFLKQQKSSKAMQKLRPELDKLREKYDPKKQEDQAKMQQEMIQLYQKSGINPLMGCLPILIQMPILMAFYFAIIRTEEIATHSFLWMDLGAPDPYYIMPALAGVLMYLQMQLSTRQLPQEMAAQMKIMQYIMPVMIVFIGIALPSALSLYWATGSLFMIIQTYVIQMRDKRNEASSDVATEQ